MTVEGQKFYPGETATAEQINVLANEYQRAADLLLKSGRSGAPLSRAPFRMAAIHSIELYLNAFLLSAKHTPGKVRRLQHDLAARTELALSMKLPLRKRTVRHLQTLSQTREFLITRYDPAA